MNKYFFLCFIFVLLFSFTSCNKKDKPKDDSINNNKQDEKICIHENKTWIVLKDSTCIDLGTKQQQCNDCGEILTTSFIPVQNHKITILSSYEATCEENGMTEGSKCSVCNTIIVAQEVIPSTGHNHILSNELSNEEINIYVCRCGNQYEIKKEQNTECLDHVLSDWNVVSDSTCSELGLKEKICTKCGIRIESDSIKLKPHTEEIIPGTNPQCEKSGLTDGIKCSKCGIIIKEQEEITSLEHEYVITNTVHPTIYEKGYIEYTCTLCNNSYKTELDKLNTYNPNESTIIFLSDDEIVITNNNGGVTTSNGVVEITLPGEYDLIGIISEGNVIINLEETERATINLQGVTIKSSVDNPISILSGDEIDISAKAGTENYIYDNRIIDNSDATGAAIYAKTDLDIKGKGSLYIESTYNNGIGTTKDLKIKNLTLNINVPNNAIKGNDSITIESGIITAISSSGDALHTEHSDISESGKQRGIIHILDGILNLYAACDGIDASYSVIIDGGEINIFTEKYSEYSGDVSVAQKDTMYIRVSSKSGIIGVTSYSALFINSDGRESWSIGVKDTSNSRYYKFDVPSDSSYVKFYAYNANQIQNQKDNYTYISDQLTINTSNDTYYITSSNSGILRGEWTNYTMETSPGGRPPGGPGGGMGPGMQEGNPDSSLYSCKGIKADNDIIINGGTINISSHDDGIHTNSDVLLETNNYGSGNLTINGGDIMITSDDDGIHADNDLIINGGNIIINKSYEGIEGNLIYFKNGTTQIKSNDDGINAKNTLYFQGGVVYLDANGDGIDSNGSVYMSGGVVLALGPTNGGNGVIDIGDRGYTFSFTGGLLLAIGCYGMNVTPTGTTGNTVLSGRETSNQNTYLTVTSNNEIVAVLKVTKTSQTYRVFAYNNNEYPSAIVSSLSSTDKELINGLYYVK